MMPISIDQAIETIVEIVATYGQPVSEVVDDLMPLPFSPDDEERLIREGLISLANDRRGMRGYRSGKVQSTVTRRMAVPHAKAGIQVWADKILGRLVFEGADGTMRSVLDFTHADALHAYDLRVRAPRERADREEPFWDAVISATQSGARVADKQRHERHRIASIAVQAKLTQGT